MSFLTLILLSATLSTIGTYIDKRIIEKGISKKDYFYYMCVTMIPFALISMILELKTQTFKFELNWIFILLLIIAGIIRYIKQKSFVGCYRKLEPYELKTYMTITLIICFIIDLIIGVQIFNVWKLLSIVLIIFGVVLACEVKVSFKKVNKDLIIRIITDVAMGYITYMALKYCSNSIFILLLNLMLVIFFTPIYKPYKDNKMTKNIFGLVLLQQTFGFSYTYINNYLSSQSVTLSKFVLPISLVLVVVSAFILKRDKKPNFRNIFGIVVVIFGILLINSF